MNPPPSRPRQAKSRTLTWLANQRQFRSAEPNQISTVWAKGQKQNKVKEAVGE